MTPTPRPAPEAAATASGDQTRAGMACLRGSKPRAVVARCDRWREGEEARQARLTAARMQRTGYE